MMHIKAVVIAQLLFLCNIACMNDSNPILESENLSLKEFSLKDSGFVFRLMNSDTWIKYIGDRGIRTLKDAENYILNSFISSYQKHGFGMYKVSLIKDNLPIGACGILKRDYLEHPDIGFAVLPEFEGKGYIHEISEAVLKYASVELKIDSIVAITSQENIRSQKLLEKLGMRFQELIKSDDSQEFMLYS